MELDDSHLNQELEFERQCPEQDEESQDIATSVPHCAFMCEICLSSPPKYTCPGCSIRTCSVQCVKIHKVKLDCTGERNKTAFVDMNQYSETEFLNDYRFLEDAERRLYSNKLMVGKRHRPLPGAPYHLGKRSKLLITAAFKRGIKLKMVSPALTKNKINTSFYTISSDTIGWHIEWHFVATNTVIKDEKVPETTLLLDAAKKHTNFVQYPHLRKCLEAYKKDKLERCKFLLKVEGLPANRPRYFELKPTTSLAENLKGHCIIEYPIIKVLAPGSCDAGYTILSKGDLTVMDKEFSSHLAKYHPELDVQAAVEAELLNPKSSVYSATKDSTDG